MPMNPERRKQYMKDYYAAKRRRPKQHGVCQYCGADGVVYGDHVVAKSRGGASSADNIRLACRTCNMSKGARGLEEWRSILARKRAGIPDFTPAQRTWMRARYGADPYAVDASTVRFHFELFPEQ